MMIDPTYTNRQYWLTSLVSGVGLSVLQSAVYILLHTMLYEESSFLFSLTYIIPLVWLSVTLAYFKWRFVYSEFTYFRAFLMAFSSGFLASLLFGGVIFVAYSFVGLESRAGLYNNGQLLNELFSPEATALSLILINISLSFVYSMIIAIFARKINK